MDNNQQVLDILDSLLGVKKDKKVQDEGEKIKERIGSAGTLTNEMLPIIHYNDQLYYKGQGNKSPIDITPTPDQRSPVSKALDDIVNFINPQKEMVSPLPKSSGGLNPWYFLRTGEVEQYNKNLKELVAMGSDGVKKLSPKELNDLQMKGITRLGGKALSGGQQTAQNGQEGQVKGLSGVKYGNIIQEVWPENQWDNIPRVLQGENGGYDPVAINHNKDGSLDIGLMQINSKTFADFMRRKPALLEKNGITNLSDLLDPVKNLKMGYIIFKEQGWNAWYAAPADLRG